MHLVFTFSFTMGLMRRLLLLLLTLLIPLQLLAATGEPQLREQLREQLQVSLPAASQGGGHVGEQVCPAAAASSWHAAADLLGAAIAPADELPSGTDDDDQPTAQGELEDPALPAPIATPGLHWFPFPHAFAASLNWSSYLHDQLRPPPLA
jgi:hypothetical protein